MGDWFIGEIRLMGFGRVPDGWLPCEGQILQIKQYQALSALLMTKFGGDGRTTFALPDLRGRVPLQVPAIDKAGAAGGSAEVKLEQSQIPPHNHAWAVSAGAATVSGVGNSWYATPAPLVAGGPELPLYAAPASAAEVQPMSDQCLKPTGANVGHDNMQPSLVMQYCIATSGTFPPHPW